MPPKPKGLCVACQGSKKNTRGRVCAICKGTGRKPAPPPGLAETIVAIMEIKRRHGKRAIKDVMTCPKCKKETLHYSVSSYNGHTAGKCETKVCLSWIE